MSKRSYISRNANAFSAQLNNFAAVLPTYATSVDVTADQVTAASNDAVFLAAVVAGQAIVSDSAQQWTAYRDEIRFGSGAGSTAPVTPNIVLPVPAVAPGVEVRFRALAKQIKASPNCTPAIEEALGIRGPEHDGPDMATVQPLISAKIEGGQVFIKWGWGGNGEFLSACEIQVDRGDGNFVLLTIDTTPNYTDTMAFPATPAKWTYRAIYRVGDNRVGQWSNPVSIAVGV